MLERQTRLKERSTQMEQAGDSSGMMVEVQLRQYWLQMELFEKFRAEGDWRRALRAIADARIAAVAAGKTDLEAAASERLLEVVRLYQGGRPG
jgi:DNA polymerase/3'-5' exonuclease PolX